MKWRACTMREALLFAKKRIEAPDCISKPPDYEASVVTFTDGTAVAVKSEYWNSGSEYTPEDGAEPPKWWIGEPVYYAGQGRGR